MIDFYRKANEKRKGELEFVPEEIEEKVMLLLWPKKKDSKKIVLSEPTPVYPRNRRVFCDVFYEHA